MKTVGNVPVETVRFLILNGSMNLPLYVRILPPIYAPIVWLVCTWKLLFRMRRSVSSGVLSCLTPRFAWKFCCLDLPQGSRCEQSNQTYSNCTGLEFICLRGPLTVEKVFESFWPRDWTQGWSVALYRIIPMFFSGKWQTICTKDSLLIFEGFPVSRTVFSLDICTFTQLSSDENHSCIE